MACKCGSHRIASINAKCSDMCHVEIEDENGFVNSSDDYAPKDMGIGGGDYIRFSYCMDCGAIQGNFPLDEAEMEVPEDSDED